MSVMLSAASAFGWVTRLTGRGDEAQLSAAVGALPPAARPRPRCFAYLSGERTPHNNAAATGVPHGLAGRARRR